MTDQQLLRDYAERRSESAFAELVRRHVDLVFSAALRMVRDTHLAEDVTQNVFLALAQSARPLADRPVLSGWLHRTAQNLAAKAVRSEVRRRTREQESAAMNELLSAEREPDWEELAPHLDAALGELDEADRDALLLRYFERKSAGEMAQTLGISGEAAQKRVSRAAERLRKVLATRGVTASASGLAIVISTNAVQAAPAGLGAAISAAAVAGMAGTATVATTAATTTTTLTKTIAMTTLQKTIIGTTLVAAVATGIYQAQRNENLRQQIEALKEQKAPLTAQIQQLQRERDQATNRLASLAKELAASDKNNLELLRLRGMAGVARRAIDEADQLRARLARQTNEAGPATNPVLGAMADAMKQAVEQQVEGRLARMTARLRLTPEQTLKARDILMRQAQAMGAGMQQAISGKFDKQEITRLSQAAGDPEAQIKALLNPDQQAAYPIHQQEEAAHNASRAANSELLQLESTLSLAADQLDGVYAALYAVNFNQLTGEATPPGDIVGNAAAMQWVLDQKVKALEPLLTPQQLDQYRQQAALQARLVKDIMTKMDGPDGSK